MPFCCKTTIVGKYGVFSVDHHPESKKIFGPIENQHQQNRAYLVGGWAYLVGGCATQLNKYLQIGSSNGIMKPQGLG